MHPKLFVCTLLVSLAWSAHASDFFFTPSLGSELEARDRYAKERQEKLRMLMQMGDDAAKAGVALSMPEWRELAQSIYGFADMPPTSLLETTLRVQNAKAGNTRGSSR